ncbi:hypothetical protein KJ673_01410 [Patescibacteria group bacterium]|nr:hypothetical protein [Patescibacteria group bacterium]MBU4452730.1 hypothetical protein [Patescibacteria group bacterium]MCG2687577.1 hypothetical protein [Candidatus Parcubacteria bacterium]
MNDRQFHEKQWPMHPNSRATNLMLEIGRLVEDTYFGLSRPGLVVKFGMEGAREYLERREIYLRAQELRRLEKKGMIIKEKIADWYWTSFSQAGFDEYITQLSLRAEELQNGQICVVSFDVPEAHRKLRNQVRYLLRRLGFEQVHRSVWSCRKNIGGYVEKLFSSRFKSDDWFKIFITSKI